MNTNQNTQFNPTNEAVAEAIAVIKAASAASLAQSAEISKELNTMMSFATSAPVNQPAPVAKAEEGKWGKRIKFAAKITGVVILGGLVGAAVGYAVDKYVINGGSSD